MPSPLSSTSQFTGNPTQILNHQGVTYMLRDLPISAKEYAFGRSKIFIRSLGVVDQLEEWRRDRVDELVVLIQKIWRGWHARQNWVKLRDSQIVISTYWKRWKDKSHITELKMRRKQEWAVVIVQKHYRRWLLASHFFKPSSNFELALYFLLVLMVTS